MVCGKCGKEINANAKFCPYCGTNIPDKVHALVAATQILWCTVIQGTLGVVYTHW